MSKELPEGWLEATLGEGLAVDVQPGFACGSHNRNAVGIAHLRPMNVSEEGRIDLSNLKFVPRDEVDRDERLVRRGDVLFNNTNSPELVGKTAYYDLPEPRAFSNHMTRVRCHAEALDPHYCAFVLHTRWMHGHFAAICNNHVSQASISRAILLETPLPIPPFAEQQRIVAKVEALLARGNAARQRLAKVPAILKRFRQSVLAGACSGDLTADWRGQHDNGDGLSATRQVDEEMPAIPIGWRYERATEVVEAGTVISYGIVLPGPNQVTGVPYVRGQDIDDSGTIHVNQLWKTTPEIASKHKRSELREGDVLLCVIRHLRVALVPPGIDGANLTQGTVRLRPSNRVRGEYMARYLASPQAQGWMKARYIGMAMPRINVEHAREIPIAVPPLAEQHEIVRRVEALFRLADAIEKRVAAATARAEKLMQAILAKAFRGELVPTEAELARREGRDFEPASALLDRIRASRAGEVEVRRPHRRRVP